MRKMAPLKKLKLAEGICATAHLHAQYMASIKGLNHKGEGGSKAFERNQAFGHSSMTKDKRLNCSISEVIGDCKSFLPTEIVVGLLADDGVKDRGHREEIFSPHAVYMGAGWSKISFESCHFVCINFARSDYVQEINKISPQLMEEAHINDYYRLIGKLPPKPVEPAPALP